VPFVPVCPRRSTATQQRWQHKHHRRLKDLALPFHSITVRAKNHLSHAHFGPHPRSLASLRTDLYEGRVRAEPTGSVSSRCGLVSRNTHEVAQQDRERRPRSIGRTGELASDRSSERATSSSGNHLPYHLLLERRAVVGHTRSTVVRGVSPPSEHPASKASKPLPMTFPSSSDGPLRWLRMLRMVGPPRTTGPFLPGHPRVPTNPSSPVIRSHLLM
jgi:hypothetical protein